MFRNTYLKYTESKMWVSRAISEKYRNVLSLPTLPKKDMEICNVSITFQAFSTMLCIKPCLSYNDALIQDTRTKLKAICCSMYEISTDKK